MSEQEQIQRLVAALRRAAEECHEHNRSALHLTQKSLLAEWESLVENTTKNQETP